MHCFHLHIFSGTSQESISPHSPGTPKAVLRSRLKELEAEFQELQAFTKLEQEINDNESVSFIKTNYIT